MAVVILKKDKNSSNLGDVSIQQVCLNAYNDDDDGHDDDDDDVGVNSGGITLVTRGMSGARRIEQNRPTTFTNSEQSNSSLCGSRYAQWNNDCKNFDGESSEILVTMWNNSKRKRSNFLINLFQIILSLLILFKVTDCDDRWYTEKQRYDGWYNNLAHPDWGSVGSRLIRKIPADYYDGVYMMAGQNRASARKLSDLFMQGDDGIASINNKTALFAFFGQLVTSEIILASENGCPIEFHKIEVDKCDKIFDKNCQGNKHIPFLRADYDRRTGHSPNSPREQINQVTSWIDGSFVYSSSEAWTNTMRSFKNGSLVTEETGQFPVRNTMRAPLFNQAIPSVMRMLSPERLYLLGDPRTNQHPALLTFGILFYRWHNVIAARVQQENPYMSDEEIFQRTRRIVVGTIQNIVMYEYLPILLDELLPKYTNYKPDLHPGISHIFQSAAFRFGHTLVPSGIYRRDDKCNFRITRTGKPAIRLCSTWWDSDV
ncbi:hypothetical protein PV325_002364, partial [Microctonus aethiopoides]